MFTIKYRVLSLAAAVMLAAATAAAAPASGTAEQPNQSYEQVARKVRKELVTLPYYGVFDNLAYKVEGDTVTLYGQVVRPSTRSDAERRVARVAGVSRVVNQIEVLPLSSFDDEIRVRSFYAISQMGGLFHYMRGVNPSIHIVVNRGNVTLEGVVSNPTHARLAYIAASQVPGVFSVTNNLRVEGRNY
ncbi:MAG TPA: BON domain-containing protein [Pyrinomonadaceae bacterium]|nr:BON domain-containing protein [Pyrinomonadaceae bacterium]